MNGTPARIRPSIPAEGPPIVPDSDDVVVYATATKRGTQLKYHCPCGGLHLHGRPAPGDGTTPYRQSHCQSPGSPLFDREYFLVEVPPDDPRLMPAPRGKRRRYV
jgi:hypothetical protein